MNDKQKYKIRIDYVPANGQLIRCWNPGKFSRLSRVEEYINASKYRIEAKGGRIIAYEIWDTSTRNCIEAKVYS